MQKASQPLWTNDHREWYRKVYLSSEHWKTLRAEKLSAQPRCERCGGRAGDVHHVNYRNLFDVTLTDLLSLCRSCHDKEHAEHGMPRRTKPPIRVEITPAVIARKKAGELFRKNRSRIRQLRKLLRRGKLKKFPAKQIAAEKEVAALLAINSQFQ